jgi:adenine phosphoribosyltransferase
MSSKKLKKAIAQYPDFPKAGIIFQDLNPLYKDAGLFKKLISAYAREVKKLGKFDFIIGVEARGFILGSALAQKLKCGFIPVRKKGKLPGKTDQVEYALEYGTDCLEIQDDPQLKNARVLIVDDVFATGGTIKAVIKLLSGLCAGLAVGLALDIGIADVKALGVDHFVVLK